VIINQLYREDKDKLGNSYDFTFADGSSTGWMTADRRSETHNMPIDGITRITLKTQNERTGGNICVDRSFVFDHPDGDIALHINGEDYTTPSTIDMNANERIAGVRIVMIDVSGMGWLTWTQYILSDGVSFRSEPNLAPNNPTSHPSLL